MEGGIICTCDDRTLDQLGRDTEWTNFRCRACGAFVHAHYPEGNPEPERLCAPCASIKWQAQLDAEG